MRYRGGHARLGALKLPESRVIAGLLIRGLSSQGWREAIHEQNVLQARNPATAQPSNETDPGGDWRRMEPDLWRMVRDGKGTVATHAVLAAAVKRSPLLFFGDFLDLFVREHYRLFHDRRCRTRHQGSIP